MLGYKGKLKFTQTAEGLVVELPAQKISDLTCALKITGSNLTPVTPPPTGQVILPDAKGEFFLSATNAELHGSQIQLETRGGLPDIGYWENGDDWVSWTVQIPEAGTFSVSAEIATPNADGEIAVEAGGGTVSARAPMTGDWGRFQTVDLGQIQIKQTGDLVVKVRAKAKATWKAVNLNAVRLIRAVPAQPGAAFWLQPAQAGRVAAATGSKDNGA